MKARMTVALLFAPTIAFACPTDVISVFGIGICVPSADYFPIPAVAERGRKVFRADGPECIRTFSKPALIVARWKYKISLTEVSTGKVYEYPEIDLRSGDTISIKGPECRAKKKGSKKGGKVVADKLIEADIAFMQSWVLPGLNSQRVMAGPPAGVKLSTGKFLPLSAIKTPAALNVALAGQIVGGKSQGKWVAGNFAQANVACLQAWVCTAGVDVLHSGNTLVVTSAGQSTNGVCNAAGGPPDSCNACSANQPANQDCQYWLETKD